MLGAVVILHQFIIHAVFIGMPSWDGLTYRIPPIVELAQHGRFGLEKYNQWAFASYVPFIKLAHAPLVYFCKLPGVLVAFPLFILPLCIFALYLFTFELTRSRKRAFFAASSYT